MFSREFHDPNPILLTDSFIGSSGILSFIIIKSIIAYNIVRNYKNGKISSILFILVSFALFSKDLPASVFISELMIYFICQSLSNEKYKKVMFLLSLTTIYDSIFIPMTLFIGVALSVRFFMMAIDPKNDVEKTVWNYIKTMGILLIQPMVFLFAISAIDLNFKNRHSDLALNYSIPFQASLKNFNIYKGFIKGHDSIENELNSSHQYVMDRSIISLLNKKHKVFFDIKDTIESSKEFVEFCEIHKIHEDEFDNEGPRFIANGDTVKFKHLIDEKFVGIKRNDPDEKFVSLKIDNSEDDSDLWEVICDGYLRAWSSEVVFKNLNSGDFLSVRMVKNDGQIRGSYHSEPSSRVFYIARNTNHPFYIENFIDEKARSTVTQFKKYGMIRMIIEYIKTIDIKANSKIENTHVSSRKKIILALFSVCFIGILILNDIIEKRYQIFIKTSYKTKMMALYLISMIVCSIKIGIRPYTIGMSSILGLLSLLLDYMNRTNYSDSDNTIEQKKLE